MENYFHHQGTFIYIILSVTLRLISVVLLEIAKRIGCSNTQLLNVWTYIIYSQYVGIIFTLFVYRVWRRKENVKWSYSFIIICRNVSIMYLINYVVRHLFYLTIVNILNRITKISFCFWYSAFVIVLRISFLFLIFCTLHCVMNITFISDILHSALYCEYHFRFWYSASRNLEMCETCIELKIALVLLSS